jgi:integrase
MGNKRDGLLPRMQARAWKNGLKISYRYIPKKGAPIPLGTDLNEAIKKVLDLTQSHSNIGKLSTLWDIYIGSADFKGLALGTQSDYKQCAKPLLEAFGSTPAALITAPMIYRYITHTRSTALIRANREKSLLSNLIDLAIRRGEAHTNPCREVRRNKEQPRSQSPNTESFDVFISWLKNQGGRRLAVAQMAEFCAFSGGRKIEFLNLTWQQVDMESGSIKMIRAKQRGNRKGMVIDVVSISPQLRELLQAIRSTNTNEIYVFPTERKMPYTSSGFKGFWGKLKTEAKIAGIDFNATFHDLRAYYATKHRQTTGLLPNLHANPETTARVYDRSTEFKRNSL